MPTFIDVVEGYLREIEEGWAETVEAIETFRKSDKSVKAAKELIRELNRSLPKMSEAKQKLVYNCQ